MDTIHILTRRIERDGEMVRAAYFGDMNDATFHKIFIEGRFTLPSDYQVVHLTADEIASDGLRVIALRDLPRFIYPDGEYIHWREAPLFEGVDIHE